MTESTVESHAMELRIRRGRRGDHEALVALGGWPAVAGSARRSIRLFRRVVADLGTDLYVAEENGSPIGFFVVSYARVLALGGERATLEELVVRSDRRGAGVGRKLLEHALARVRRRGVRALRAAAPDEGARLFLERAGFRAAAACYEWRVEADG